MLSQRPFKDRTEVFESAERIWWDIGPADWLEAFAGHARIGGQVVSESGGQAVRRSDGQTGNVAGDWAAQEQAGAAAAGDDVKAALEAANIEYEARFGYIYVVCATGRSGAEMLALCRVRLANDPDTELKVAAGEQLAITRIRLEKLLTV